MGLESGPRWLVPLLVPASWAPRVHVLLVSLGRAIAAVDGLPVPGPGAIEGYGVGVGHQVVGHALGAGVLGSEGARVVGVDGVGHRPAGSGRGPGQGGAVMNRAADRARRRREGRRDRRAVLADRQGLARAGTGVAGVIGIAAVDGLPVPGPGAIEGDGVAVWHD